MTGIRHLDVERQKRQDASDGPGPEGDFVFIFGKHSEYDLELAHIGVTAKHPAYLVKFLSQGGRDVLVSNPHDKNQRPLSSPVFSIYEAG